MAGGIKCHHSHYIHKIRERKEKNVRLKRKRRKVGNCFFVVKQILFKMAHLPDAPRLKELADGNYCRWIGTAEAHIQLRVAGSAMFAFLSANHSYSTFWEWVAKKGEVSQIHGRGKSLLLISLSSLLSWVHDSVRYFAHSLKRKIYFAIYKCVWLI